MLSLQTPFIVVDKGGADLSIYDSTEAVEKHLEAIDVRHNEYVAYDANGRRLQLEAKGKFVSLTAGDDESSHAGELAGLLKHFLKSAGQLVPRGQSADELRELIDACRQIRP